MKLYIVLLLSSFANYEINISIFQIYFKFYNA